MDSDDFDDFDDDIADEDLIVAASQAPTRHAHSKFVALPPQSGLSNILGGSLRNGLGPRQTAQTGSVLEDATSFIDLDDFPSDAFSSPPSGSRSVQLPSRDGRQAPRVGAPVPAFRQTTLFGTAVQEDEVQGSTQRLNSNRVFRADLPPEAPTHHELDLDAMKTWVYPTNLGPIRDYQFSIVKNGLFNNTLVALPTGLGKTFIAATIMLNFFRWTKSGKIIFVAPTKPLVSQQVDACFNIAGIPRSQTTLLTGDVSPGLRAEEWKSKRVFFMTPQTLENDLSSGYADPKTICLLVVDEAHRATGNYAYAKVVTFMRRFSNSFRILALTATPGSKVEAVQEVIDNLGISHVEIRTEESLDIRQYVHQRDEDVVLLDPSDEMVLVKELFSKALKPLVDKLSQQNIYYGRDPMALTNYGLMQARKDWAARAGQHANQGVKFMMMAIFSILGSLAHSIKLLNFHGMKPFYENLLIFREDTEKKGEKGSKFKRQVIESPEFQKMMSTLRGWASKEDFISHPKLTYLCDTVLNHFLDAGDGRDNGSSSNTRIIVFSEYRDSAEEIVRVLNTHKPMIRAAVFVGQAATTKSDGMKQSEQIERIKKFKEGTFNVLVATSIGEEGLDIGQVDLIICFDASASPIRMLQRMGRTGRKRAGKVVLLLMRGKEEDNYAKSKDGYEKMQIMICEGSRFAFRHDLSTRIVPREIKPEVDKRSVDIPIENTQNNSLPEPKKGRPKSKKPPKKFHMPEGVETGFTSVASMLGKRPNSAAKLRSPPGPVEADAVAEVPVLDQVLLNSQQSEELRRIYQKLPFHRDKVQEIAPVKLTATPHAQRAPRKTVHLKHGEHTKRCVRLFRTLSKSQSTSTRFHKPYGETDQSNYSQIELPEELSDSEPEYALDVAPPPRKKRKTAPTVTSGHPNGTTGSRTQNAQSVALGSKTKAVNKKTKTQGRRPKVVAVEVEDEDDDEDQDQDTDLSEIAVSPPPRPPKKLSKRAPGAKRAPSTKKQLSRVYDESADDGDDCRRTSDLELSNDSDEGSDLIDFVVGDDVATSSVLPTSSMRRLSTSPTSSSSTPGPPPVRHKPYYEPIQLSATQDTEDDIPSMSQIMRKPKRLGPKSTITSNSEDDEEVLPRAGRASRRRVVLDDEDDDSDDSCS